MNRANTEVYRDNRKNTIEAWMLEITRDGGIERFDDLHIDRIDSDWKHKSRWIEGALAAHKIALSLRNLHALPVTVVAAFSLNTEPRPIGAGFQTVQELEARLDWTPPSLYLHWREGTVDFRRQLS